jgi:hypothetical protein
MLLMGSHERRVLDFQDMSLDSLLYKVSKDLILENGGFRLEGRRPEQLSNYFRGQARSSHYFGAMKHASAVPTHHNTKDS